METNKEFNLKLIKILINYGRISSAIGVFHEVIQLNPKLNEKERSLLINTYKNLFNKKRKAMNILETEMKNKSEKDNEKNEIIKACHEIILNEMKNIYYEIIKIIDEKLLPSAENLEAKIIYLKMKADFSRYVCEYIEEKDKKLFIEKAELFYNESISLTKNVFPKNSSIVLGLILNYSVFMYEIQNNKNEAISLLQNTVNECLKSINDIEDIDSNTRTLLQMIFDNITIWST